MLILIIYKHINIIIKEIPIKIHIIFLTGLFLYVITLVITTYIITNDTIRNNKNMHSDPILLYMLVSTVTFSSP